MHSEMRDRVPSIDIPVGDYEHGQPPPVCPKHGLPATETSMRKFYTRDSPWLVVLIIVSLALALIVALAIRSSVSGRVPRCEQCARARRQTVTVLALLWLVLLATFLPITASGTTTVTAVWFVALVVVVAGSIVAPGRSSVRGWLTNDKRYVHLKDVHPNFAVAVSALIPVAH